MNKKGFTLIELITTLALTAAIIVILVNIVLIIKNIYLKYDVKTELVIDQSILSKEFNKVLRNGENITTTCTTGSTNCTFTVGGDTITLTITSNKITFGKYTYKAPTGTTIGSLSFVSDTTLNIYKFSIPITNTLYPGVDFGVMVIYLT